jgi:2-hydroxychromene-2-carboxylate isomerase
MMIRIDWYFDVISPYSYLAFERLPEALARASSAVDIRYRPVLFAGLLEYFGQKGPAEIASKRRFTYEHVLWLASRHNVRLHGPPRHPFNPLPLLRALVAAGGIGESPTRHQVELAFHYVWQQGLLPDEPALENFLTALGVTSEALGVPEVKAQLRANTEAAIADEVFGVPTAVVRKPEEPARRFWGFDALPMMVDFVNGHALFSSAEMARAAILPTGLQRKTINP